MENIIAHSLEKLYTEFEKADQFFLDSGMKDMDTYEKSLAEAARRAAAEQQALYTAWTGCCVMISWGMKSTPSSVTTQGNC